MTDANRRQNVEDEVRRGEESLKAAEGLIALNLHADSVSRAYYAVLHYLRAALFSRGLEPKTHAGALHLFNAELVRAGLFPSSFNRTLAAVQRGRELADYDAAAVFSADDATAQLDDARRFSAAVRAFLVAGGWLNEAS